MSCYSKAEADAPKMSYVPGEAGCCCVPRARVRNNVWRRIVLFQEESRGYVNPPKGACLLSVNFCAYFLRYLFLRTTSCACRVCASTRTLASEALAETDNRRLVAPTTAPSGRPLRRRCVLRFFPLPGVSSPSDVRLPTESLLHRLTSPSPLVGPPSYRARRLDPFDRWCRTLSSKACLSRGEARRFARCSSISLVMSFSLETSMSGDKKCVCRTCIFRINPSPSKTLARNTAQYGAMGGPSALHWSKTLDGYVRSLGE